MGAANHGMSNTGWHHELLHELDAQPGIIQLVEVRDRNKLQDEAVKFARFYKRARGKRCCYSNHAKRSSTMARCREMAEGCSAGSRSLFVVVLHQSVCNNKIRMVPMLNYLEHLQGGWVFRTRPFSARNLEVEQQVVVFAAKAPEEKYVCGEKWMFWEKI